MKKRISQTLKGRKHSEEHSKKISEAKKGKQPFFRNGHPLKGKHLTEEHRKKLSEAHKGKTPWNKGKKMPEEFCKKDSEAKKGKPWSAARREAYERSKKGTRD